MVKLLIALCALIVCVGLIHSVPNPKVMCFYEYWSVYHKEVAMKVGDIDNSMCTHRIYGFLGVDSNADVLITDAWAQTDPKGLKQLDAWGKNKGNDLSLIAIGGAAQSVNLHYAAQNPTTFVSNVVKFLKKYNMDGIVIDWSQNWENSYMQDYVSLLGKLKTEFAANHFVLASTVSSDRPGYDIKSVSDNVDAIIVFTVDYAGFGWHPTTGHASALSDQKLAINDWYSKGAAPEKLIMTVPFYGRTWTLKDPTKNGLDAEATGPGTKGKYTDTAGILSYNELMLLMKANPTGWTSHVDDEAGGAYVSRGDQWISIEVAATAEKKANWATSQGFGGIAVLAVDNDDFNALVSPTKHPLLTGIHTGLDSSPVTKPPYNPTNPPTVTPDPHALCHEVGWVKDPKDPCHTYHHCTYFMPGQYTDNVLHCAKDLAYDEKTHTCIDHTKVPGC